MKNTADAFQHLTNAKSSQSHQTKLDCEIPWDTLVFSHSLGPKGTSRLFP